MHVLTRDQIVYSLDKTHPPAIEIKPGATLRLETYDARTGTIRSNADLLDRPHPKGANPATGPILIKGAQPGDSLAVEILKIDLAEEGFLAIMGTSHFRTLMYAKGKRSQGKPGSIPSRLERSESRIEGCGKRDEKC